MLTEFVDKGTLSSLNVAKSRSNTPMRVPDLLLKDSENIFKMVFNEESTILICGNTNFSSAIVEIIKTILVDKNGSDFNINE